MCCFSIPVLHVYTSTCSCIIAKNMRTSCTFTLNLEYINSYEALTKVYVNSLIKILFVMNTNIYMYIYICIQLSPCIHFYFQYLCLLASTLFLRHSFLPNINFFILFTSLDYPCMPICQLSFTCPQEGVISLIKSSFNHPWLFENN